MNQMVEVWGDECFSGRGNNVHTSREVDMGRLLNRRQSIQWERKLWGHA